MARVWKLGVRYHLKGYPIRLTTRVIILIQDIYDRILL